MPSPFFRAIASALLLILLSAPPAVRADPALPSAASYGLDGLAPAGHWAARLTVLENGYGHRFDNTGKRQDLDRNSNQALMPFGVRLDTQITTDFLELMVGYGLTPDLTLGAILPYARTTSRLHLAGTPANITRLQGGLAALGYRSLATRATSGMSDPTLGILWRVRQSSQDSLVLGLGVRLGLAKADDPDDLCDIPPGDGSTDLRLRGEYFRELGNAWDLRLLAEHQIQLPDEAVMRPGGLYSPTKEKLRRDLGNYQEFDLELGKTLGDWRVSSTWHRYQEAADRYTSRRGSETRQLSAHTHTQTDQLRFSLAWSGIRAWQDHQLPLPLILKLEVQDAVRGRNFVDVRDIYLRLTSFF